MTDWIQIAHRVQIASNIINISNNNFVLWFRWIFDTLIIYIHLFIHRRNKSVINVQQY